MMLEYYVQVQKCLIAGSISEAFAKTKRLVAELKRLNKWEKEGKLKTSKGVDENGFQNFHILDDSIGPEVRKMNIVIYFEIDEFVDESLYPELFGDD